MSILILSAFLGLLGGMLFYALGIHDEGGAGSIVATAISGTLSGTVVVMLAAALFGASHPR